MSNFYLNLYKHQKKYFFIIQLNSNQILFFINQINLKNYLKIQNQNLNKKIYIKKIKFSTFIIILFNINIDSF